MDSDNSSYFSASAPASRSDNIQVAHAEVSRDDVFYFSLVTFKVENCLFRVPKHELEEQSHVFRDMFSMPTAEGTGEVEGTSDDNPIHLEAINKEEFKLLLKLLYPPGARDIATSLTVEQCSSLLKLSHMWGFNNIRLIAKSQIRNALWSTIQPVDKIRLAHDHELEDWYADAYFELATRSEPLSIEEAYKLGLEFSTKMARVREKVAAARNGISHDVHHVARAARAAIDEVFLVAPASELLSPEERDTSWDRAELAEEQAYADEEAWSRAEAEAVAEAREREEAEEARVRMEARAEARAVIEAKARMQRQRRNVR